MITYRATLDVPEHTARTVAGWLRAHRAACDLRPEQRAASARVQAVMVLRWLREGTTIWLLARDAGISQATGYRYIHEAIEVIAGHGHDLNDVIDEAVRKKWTHLCLDGTLIPTTRCSARSDSRYDLWYSGKHAQHGANVQVLTAPDGYPVWVSPAEPGSTHDITCARQHVLGALYRAASQGLKTLTDKGYEGAGIGIESPIKGHNLAVDNRARNRLINALRAPAERGNALLKSTWRGLRRISVDPSRITQIITTALVLLHLQKPTR